jgi:hypothetical protein
MPALSVFRDFVEAGGLMSYWLEETEMWTEYSRREANLKPVFDNLSDVTRCGGQVTSCT